MTEQIIDLSIDVIHYGANVFNPSKFYPIENASFFNKPYGGLWTSLVQSKYGWRKFCINNNLRTYALNKSFIFKYEGKTIVIDSKKSLVSLPLYTLEDITYALQRQSIDHEYKMIDFKKISNFADAIYLTVNGINANNELFYLGNYESSLYGWDCESILIMNQNKILV